MLYLLACGYNLCREMGKIMKHATLQKLNKALLCLLLAGFSILLLGVLQGGLSLDYSDFAGTERTLNGWTLLAQGLPEKSVLLPQSYQSAAGATFVARLDDLGVGQGQINLLHCKTGSGLMTVRVGQRTIYSCANAVVGFLSTVSTAHDHYIPITADDFGQPISMTLMPPRGGDSVALYSVLLTTKASALVAATLENLWCICLDFAILIVGLIMVLAYCVMLRYAKHPPMLWLGLFLTSYAVYKNAYLNALLVMFIDRQLCHVLLYALIGIIGVFWLLFAFYLNKKRHARSFDILILAVLVNSLASLLLYAFLPNALGQSLLLLDFTVIIAMAFGLFVLMVDYFRFRDIGRHTAMGMAGSAALAALGMLDAFFSAGTYTDLLFSLSVLCFTVWFTIGLVVSGIDALVLQSRMHALELAAYQDPLTGCKNRRAFDQKMQTYRKAEDTGVMGGLAMAMFDSNNLKIVNDTYGHARGDRLIIDTADALGRYLGGFGIVYRIGGDEFVVVCDNTDRRALGVALEAFDREVNTKDEAGIDVSWGIAYYKSALDNDPDSVLMRAEHRMYEYKKGCKL